MKKFALAAAITALTSAYAQADTYQVEVGANYSQTDYDGFEVDTSSLNAEIFFSEVDTSKGPLAEASFLDKASGLGLSYDSISPEVGDSTDNWSTDIRFVTSGSLIIEATYSDLDFDSVYGIGIGTYLNDTTDIVVSYSTTDESDVDTLAVDLHNVTSLSGDSSLGYNVAAVYVDTDDDSGYGIAGELTYYVNNNLGFGAFADITSVGDADVTNYGLNADYFINSMVRIVATYATTDFDSELTADTLSIGVSARF